MVLGSVANTGLCAAALFGGSYEGHLEGDTAGTDDQGWFSARGGEICRAFVRNQFRIENELSSSKSYDSIWPIIREAHSNCDDVGGRPVGTS